MKKDVAVLGVVRNGERAPADWRRGAVFAAQVLVFTGFTAETAWLSAWWAMVVVVLGAALITAMQALFRWHEAREAPARPGRLRDAGGFRIVGDVGYIACGACEQARRRHEEGRQL